MLKINPHSIVPHPTSHSIVPHPTSHSIVHPRSHSGPHPSSYLDSYHAPHLGLNPTSQSNPHIMKTIQSPVITSKQYIQSIPQTNLKSTNSHKLNTTLTSSTKSINKVTHPAKSFRSVRKPVKVWAPSHSAQNQTIMSPYIVQNNKISKKYYMEPKF